MELRTLT